MNWSSWLEWEIPFGLNGSRYFKCGKQHMLRTPLLKNHKTIGFLATLVQIPWKIIKLPSQIHCRAVIGTPAKRHLNGVSLAGRSWPAYIAVWILSLSSLTKKTKQKKTFLSWNPSDKTFWIRACRYCCIACLLQPGMVKAVCKRIGHKPDERKLVKSLKNCVFLCSLEKLLGAIGIVSVDLKVHRRLFNISVFLLFYRKRLYTVW